MLLRKRTESAVREVEARYRNRIVAMEDSVARDRIIAAEEYQVSLFLCACPGLYEDLDVCVCIPVRASMLVPAYPHRRWNIPCFSPYASTETFVPQCQGEYSDGDRVLHVKIKYEKKNIPATKCAK
eukprot:1131295-Rhodomonas_salina.1